MRRSVANTVLCVVPVIAAGSVILAGCEDGPNQTFAPASGTLFNSGDVDGSVDPVDAGFDTNYSGQTALQICTADEKRARWAQMLNEVIVPPALYGGLDLRGCDATQASDLTSKPCEWPGLTIEHAEQLPTPSADGGLQGGNCQGIATGYGGCAENANDTCGAIGWGDNIEVNFWYDSGTHLIDQLDISIGYLGKMTWQGVNSMDGPTDPSSGQPSCQGKAWASQPGQEAKFSLQLGYPITKNNAPYQVRWGTTFQSADLAELYDSMAKTYYPASGGAWPGCTRYDCQGSGTCLDLTNDGAGTGIFGVRPLGTYFQFHSTLPQPAASIPFGIYVDYVKFVPNSTQDMWLSLNQQGPFTNSQIPNAAGGIQSNGGTCQQAIGQTYGDYLTNCIQPYSAANGGTALNLQNYNKMAGGHTHNLEEVTFNLVGINQDFTLTPDRLNNAALPGGTNLGTYGFVGDGQLPLSGDQSSEWYFDIRAFGAVHNEIDDGWNGAAGAGTGLVAREYQRLVELDLTRLYNLQHGTSLLPSLPGDCEFASDPTLTGSNICLDSNGAALTGGCQIAPLNPGHLCTGFEGMLLAGAAAYSVAQGDVAGRTKWADSGFGGSVLKPGDHYVAFAENPTAYQKWAFGQTNSFAGADAGPWWDQSLNWVIRILGHGDINNLPQQVADRRYFFKWFGVAMVKYLKAYGDVLATDPSGASNIDHTKLNPLTVAAEPIDLETLFFDHSSLDKFEYIDLSTIAGYGNTTATDPNKPSLQVPFDYEYGTDVKVANQRYTNWYKRLDREEFAMYQALSPHKSDPPGAHANLGVNLTNMFGSPLLATAFKDYECAAAVWKFGAWHADPEGLYPTAASDCTTVYSSGPPHWLLDLVDDPVGGTEVMDLNGQMALEEQLGGSSAAIQGSYHAAVLDQPNGNTTAPGAAHPLLWQYPAVWGGQTVFSQGHSPIQVCPPGATNCDPNQGSAVTSIAIGAAVTMIPSFKDPWHACAQLIPGSPNTMGTCDPTNSTYVDSTIHTFVPWTPSQPGVGFTIPVNGSSDLMVQTDQLDFTGNLEEYTVDYVPYVDPALTSCAYAPTTAPNGGCNTGFTCQGGACTASDNTIEIRAIEARDFLGEVFMCQDPLTGDVLHMRMYTPVADVLAWLTAHPGNPQNVNFGPPSAQTQCGIIVRYSPFDNYPDFITSLTYGVSIAIDPGLGLGRVFDATLFNPVYETITQ